MLATTEAPMEVDHPTSERGTKRSAEEDPFSEVHKKARFGKSHKIFFYKSDLLMLYEHAEQKPPPLKRYKLSPCGFSPLANSPLHFIQRPRELNCLRCWFTQGYHWPGSSKFVQGCTFLELIRLSMYVTIFPLSAAISGKSKSPNFPKLLSPLWNSMTE